MGSVSDIVHFSMMQPLQGQTTKSPNPIALPNVEDQTSNSNPMAEGIASGVKDIGSAIAHKNKMQTPAPNESLPASEASPDVIPSDENLKTNINQADKKLDGFLSHLGAHQYEYKNPKRDGIGTHFGPMAQELEKSAVGKQAIINTKDGKMVNTGRLVLPLLSAAAMHNEQIANNTSDIKAIKKEVIALSKFIKNRKK